MLNTQLRTNWLFPLSLLSAAIVTGCGGSSNSSNEGLNVETTLNSPVTTLREQVGDVEAVNLNIYLVGFPEESHSQAEQAISARLQALDIVDTKPWWIPRIPKFGEESFALTPAPTDLPEELTPPDGMIRYDATSFTREQNEETGQTHWTPLREINEAVDDWHQNVDIVNYVEHDGAYTDVRWEISNIVFHHITSEQAAGLQETLEESKIEYTSSQPAQSFNLYSYNTLFDWLDESNLVQQANGGASLVFLNLPELNTSPYSFYSEPQKDSTELRATAPAEVQFPAVTAANSQYQSAADIMTDALNGGLSQVKMFAALEVFCDNTLPANHIENARAEQTYCEQWRLDPIVNLLGNQSRRLFVSDATRLLSGGITTEETTELADNAFELYRYGVLQTSLKANNVYSEAYELRILTVDIRYDATELCILDALENEQDPQACLTDSSGFVSEQDYEFADVFDESLARHSMSQFVPAQWQITQVPFPFGIQPDGSIDRVAGTLAKAGLRLNLNEPRLPNPTGGEPIVLTHPPLYRELQFLNDEGGFDTLTSSWENGVDPNVAQAAFSNTAEEGGFGAYEQFWPEARVVDEVPFHKSGVPNVKALVFFMTPSPSGSSGEKWGTFPYNTTAWANFNFNTTWGGGGWWGSVAGNEQGGAILRRDFFLLTPQYFLGKNRGNGSSLPMAVMPDGSVEANEGFDNSRALEIGTIHWVDQFDANAPRESLANSFVRETSTLQAIETLQHGLGYMHAPEPRRRFHFDGGFSTLARQYALAQDPSDTTGELLHRYVNQYTTHGISTVWGQSTSDWNSAAPQTGMQSTLFRSHAREAIAAAETELSFALEAAIAANLADNSDTLLALSRAREAHDSAKQHYADWSYREAIEQAWQMLHQLDIALTALGHADRIIDPVSNLSFPEE